MTLKRFTLEVHTEGNTDVKNLSPELAKYLRDVQGEGLVHLFVIGSTAALTTIEFEPGLVKHDLAAMLEKIAPEKGFYHHEQTWNDDNGHSHLRSSLLGPGLTVPVSRGRLLTGEYQQVVLVDFDTRPRKRTVVGTIIA